MTDPEALLSIWTRISKGRGIDYRMPTGLAVPYKYWDKKKERPKNYTGDNQDVADFLVKLDKRLTSLRIRLYESAIMHETFTKDMAKAIIDDVVSVVKDDGIPRDVVLYCRMIIDQMKSGTRTLAPNGRSTTTEKGNRYSDGTIESWMGFLRVLEGFSKSHTLSWEAITETKLVEFKKYLSDYGYMNATINKHIISFKALAAMAQDDGIHVIDPKVYRKLSKVDVKKSDAKKTKVYLTNDELQGLYDMPLRPGSKLDQVRDIFLMGCYTGQRVSDYNHLDPSMFGKTERKGYDIVKLTQHKTGNEVTIPVINEHLLDIAEKYNYEIPTIAEVTLNKDIKLLCKRLAASIPSLNAKVVSTLTMKDEEMDKRSIAEGKGPIYTRDAFGRAIMSKWELVSTHTARRSCVTNMYLSGIWSESMIMHVSGHKDVGNFKRYLLMSGEDIAEKIIDKMNEAAKNGNSLE